MHSLRHHLTTGAIVLATALTALAQAPEKGTSVPKHIIATPPGDIVWTIRYTYKDSKKKDDSEKIDKNTALSASEQTALEAGGVSRPDKVRCIIRKPVSMKVADLVDGKKEDAFYYANFEFRIAGQKRQVYKSDLDQYPTIEQLFQKKLPGVDWVRPKHFVKVDDSQGEPCAYFRDGNPVKRDPDQQEVDAISDDSKYEIREAWFSLKTGLPVAFKAGETLAKYTFEPDAKPEIVIPADIKEAINKHARYEKYLKDRAALGKKQ